MFSLIPNADEFVFSLDDEYGNFTWSFYNRENLSERFGMEYFTADTVKEAAGSLDSYTNYLNMVSAIKNTEDSYGESQKQNIERSKQVERVKSQVLSIVAKLEHMIVQENANIERLEAEIGEFIVKA